MEPYYPYIAMAVVICLYVYVDDVADRRYIRRLLAENDRMWTDMVNKNLKSIAEAYQDGKQVTFNIERI